MAIMTWNSSLSVKVKKFDEQHMKLVNMVNELHDAMKDGKGAEVLGKILNGLITYTATHFKEEEQMMATHAYPGLTAHKLEHEKLVKQVLDLQQQYKSGKPIITIAVLNFLKDWLVKHIQGEDKKYGEYFTAKGIIC